MVISLNWLLKIIPEIREMNEVNFNKTILIIGPLSPPAGGISIHIERLTNLLKDDFNFDFIDESTNIKKEFFNIRELNFFTYIQKIRKSQLVYIHSGNTFLKKSHIIFSKLFRKKIILTFHGFDRFRNKLSDLTSKLLYRLADKIVVVNIDISDAIAIATIIIMVLLPL